MCFQHCLSESIEICDWLTHFWSFGQDTGSFMHLYNWLADRQTIDSLPGPVKKDLLESLPSTHGQTTKDSMKLQLTVLASNKMMKDMIPHLIISAHLNLSIPVATAASFEKIFLQMKLMNLV